MTIERLPSLSAAADERNRAIELANDRWNTLAEQFMARIPTDLRLFAIEKGWLRSEIPEALRLQHWNLPSFLEATVRYSHLGSCTSDKIRDTELGTYGFTSFVNLRAKMRTLAKAWSGLVLIQVDTREGYRAEIKFTAAEVVSKPKKKRK